MSEEDDADIARVSDSDEGEPTQLMGGHSYLDESITPMMTPMKAEEVNNSRIMRRQQLE